MKVYLVGGAVRDKLLNLTIKEKDYVVVGSTPEELIKLGYLPVGNSFPVFLHPETKEEYALARKEIKKTAGYKGFDCFFDKKISLEDDLKRRDLTINAMAELDGAIIDPYNGLKDLKNKILRHVSNAFVEDPVRVLRVARFAARFKHLGFSIAEETMELMKSISNSGELDALIAERVWKETEKAITEKNPSEFFIILKECGALAKLFPEIDVLFGIPNPEKWHPEIDTGIHTMMCLDMSAKLTQKPEVRFGALVHDIGKSKTDKTKWPKHINHEMLGAELVKKISTRYTIPNSYFDMGILATRYHTIFHIFQELRPVTMVKTFEKIDAYRRPERLNDLLIVCEADYRGRKTYEDKPYAVKDYVISKYIESKNISIKKLLNDGLSGEKLKIAIRNMRIKAISRQTSKCAI